MIYYRYPSSRKALVIFFSLHARTCILAYSLMRFQSERTGVLSSGLVSGGGFFSRILLSCRCHTTLLKSLRFEVSGTYKIIIFFVFCFFVPIDSFAFFVLAAGKLQRKPRTNETASTIYETEISEMMMIRNSHHTENCH
jgi:hypothetical protein